ncbi:MAG: putative sulfate exporter family transporter [Firmicutes bacterium]|nr:putative sulfate exporter family transporter [Bacillota bacterium]
MTRYGESLPGIMLCLAVAIAAVIINNVLPVDLLGIALISLLLGMMLNPIISKYTAFAEGVNWTSKRLLRAGIILTGISLSFVQVVQAGKYALLLLCFTLATAFGVGYLCSKVFKINWKLSSLLSVSTAICGGTAVATVGPVIKAEDKEIAYALSATFIFDLLTVIAFPWIGMALGLSDTGYGLWVGTSVNDTSSVIAAGYAFSDPAGALATIVKLTRTLFIVPITLIFSWIYTKKQMQSNSIQEKTKVKISKIFPWFILGFLMVVGVRSTGLLPGPAVNMIAKLAKFLLATALGAIGMKTSFIEVAGVGVKPAVAGVVIDTSVVIVALVLQALIIRFMA